MPRHPILPHQESPGSSHIIFYLHTQKLQILSSSVHISPNTYQSLLAGKDLKYSLHKLNSTKIIIRQPQIKSHSLFPSEDEKKLWYCEHPLQTEHIREMCSRKHAEHHRINSTLKNTNKQETPARGNKHEVGKQIIKREDGRDSTKQHKDQDARPANKIVPGKIPPLCSCWAYPLRT